MLVEPAYKSAGVQLIYKQRRGVKGNHHWLLLVQEREGSLNTSASGLAGGRKSADALAYQADAEGEGSGSDPAGVQTRDEFLCVDAYTDDTSNTIVADSMTLCWT